MSLVAYAASSDEDSDCDTTEEINVVPVKQSQNPTLVEPKPNGQTASKLNLPQPKHAISDDDDDTDTNNDARKNDFEINLPAPTRPQTIVEEADDEFLHKKVQPSLVEKPTKSKPGIRQPVKITIPSLSEFAADDVTPNGKSFKLGPNPKKSCGLLNALPPPKFNGTFIKSKETSASSAPSTSVSTIKPTITKTTSLIPHSVSKKQAAAKIKPIAEKKPTLGLTYNNSDDSDNEDGEGGDFFSLNAEEKLPDVSAAEINAMVAKKANRMAELSRNLNEEQTTIAEDDTYAQPSSSSVSQNEDINIEALIGVRAAKRSRKEEIQFIDISQDQVTSSYDEWTRNQLQSETQFQPTSRLNVGDGPGAGTKKKHQITYLAHQAKANEAELQAMWATNRQSRRQTQSKYGF